MKQAIDLSILPRERPVFRLLIRKVPSSSAERVIPTGNESFRILTILVLNASMSEIMSSNLLI